jgi:hypothetical protein
VLLFGIGVWGLAVSRLPLLWAERAVVLVSAAGLGLFIGWLVDDSSLDSMNRLVAGAAGVIVIAGGACVLGDKWRVRLIAALVAVAGYALVGVLVGVLFA